MSCSKVVPVRRSVGACLPSATFTPCCVCLRASSTPKGVKANVLFFTRKPASESAWTQKLWIYDLRTNKHFTLKTSPLRRQNLDDFVNCFNPDNIHDRQETERFKSFSYDDLMKRDKVSLDIFWLRDESLEDSDNLPDPDVLAESIVQELEGALEQFREVVDGLGDGV